MDAMTRSKIVFLRLSDRSHRFLGRARTVRIIFDQHKLICSLGGM